jgi:hypothetical protein
MTWTRLGLERQRFLVITSMMRSGSTFAEALAYADLMYPLVEVHYKQR